MYRKALIGTLFFFSSLFFVSSLFAQADVIESRQKLMKSNGAIAKAVRGAAEQKDYGTVETKAKELMGNAEKIRDLFPQNSTKGKTKATGAIWDKWDEFGGNARALGTAARELADAAKAGDDGAVSAKVKAVGGTCSNCHKAFRADKYSE